jgi:ligand-binding sensor domain-containing protein
MKKLRHVLITILILSSLAATAQTPRLYTPESGLINTQINNLYQDTDGFIWICTEGGLLKFDGMGFELFRHERDKSTSIISNTVNQIFEDSRGVKWVGTSNGLQIFNSDYNTFSTFDFGRDINGQRVEFVNNILEVPFEDSGSNLFISTGGTGVFVIDTKTHKLLTQKRKKISAYLNSKYIRSLFLDSERRLWVALASGGAVVLNADSLEPDRKVHWETDLQSDFSHIRIEGFAEDPVTNNVAVYRDVLVISTTGKDASNIYGIQLQ